MNRIFITFLLVFVCNTLVYSITDDEKPTVYINKSRKITDKELLAKYNYINVDKDPEMFISKKRIKNLNTYLKEDIDISQINTDSLFGNVFSVSFIIDQEGKIKDIQIKAGITPQINKEIINRLEKIKCKPGKKGKEAISVVQDISFLFTDINRPTSFVPLKGGKWMPEFVGGHEILMMYISKNLRYPYMSDRKMKDGQVIAQFIVNKTGKIENVEIVKSLGVEYDKEVIRMIKAMPDWSPGYKDGELASVIFTLPISFKHTNW